MQTFTKDERLCSKKSIQELFEKGHEFFRYPFKVVWIKKEGDFKFPSQVLISVSKRNFKLATDRNHIKRLIREAYRINKTTLFQSLIKNQVELDLAIIYTAKEIASFKEIEKRIIQIFERLIKENEEITA